MQQVIIKQKVSYVSKYLSKSNLSSVVLQAALAHLHVCLG